MGKCAVIQCYNFVDRDGLVGFCKEHRENALLFHIEGLEARLDEQKKTLERVEYNQRVLSQQIQQSR
jgi:hypothetical protein